MKATFYESSDFSATIATLIDDAEYGAMQQELMENPDLGNVMPGCGGLRKLRFALKDRGKGKRGGLRIV